MLSLLIQNEAIWVSKYPTDLRNSVNGLCALVVEQFEAQPQQGLYVFYNSRRNRLKILLWHYNGFMLIYKRLEQSRFPFSFAKDFKKVLIEEKQLQGLLLGLDWERITRWKEINFAKYF